MKTRPELFDEMAADDLTESAALAHLTALGWLYRIEHDDCLIPRRLVAKILTLTADPIGAVAELCAADYWREEGKHFRVVHDAGTVRQSLAAQWGKRDKDARGKASAKAKRDSENAESASMPAALPASAPQPNNLTTEQPARTGDERLSDDFHPASPPGDVVLDRCAECAHRERLGPDALCDDCASANGGPGHGVGHGVTEAEADLAPEPPRDHLSERARLLREMGEAS